MKKFSKTLLSVATVTAVSAVMAVSAMADELPLKATYLDDGTVKLENVESTGASQTILILSSDTTVTAENANTIVKQIDQQDNGTSFATVIVGDLADGTYYVRIGGTDGSIQKASFTVGDEETTDEDNDNDNDNDNDSESGSSTSGNGGGTGPIAGGNSNNGTNMPGIGLQPHINFQDLGSVQWAVPAIDTLVSLGIVNGRSDTIFDPNADVTRAEFTKMVCIAFSVPATQNSHQNFTDVAPTDWFYGYVQAAAERGFVNGVTDTTFDPNATITREQMAAILYRAAQATGGLSLLKQDGTKVFDDEYLIDEYAKIPVATLSATGVINGVTDKTFEPDATATRAQSAAIIYQYYKAVGVA